MDDNKNNNIYNIFYNTLYNIYTTKWISSFGNNEQKKAITILLSITTKTAIMSEQQKQLQLQLEL